ncbi:MAG: hypothetical protein ACOCVF_02080 [bacterium]
MKNIFNKIQIIREMKGGHWIKTKKRGWIKKENYNSNMIYRFDPEITKEEIYD